MIDTDEMELLKPLFEDIENIFQNKKYSDIVIKAITKMVDIAGIDAFAELMRRFVFEENTDILFCLMEDVKIVDNEIFVPFLSEDNKGLLMIDESIPEDINKSEVLILDIKNSVVHFFKFEDIRTLA